MRLAPNASRSFCHGLWIDGYLKSEIPIPGLFTPEQDGLSHCRAKPDVDRSEHVSFTSAARHENIVTNTNQRLTVEVGYDSSKVQLVLLFKSFWSELVIRVVGRPVVPRA